MGGRERRPGDTFLSLERRETEALLRLLRGRGGLALVGAILMAVLSCKHKALVNRFVCRVQKAWGMSGGSQSYASHQELDLQGAKITQFSAFRLKCRKTNKQASSLLRCHIQIWKTLNRALQKTKHLTVYKRHSVESLGNVWRL